MKRDGIEVFHGLSNEMPVGLFHSGIASVVTIHDVAFKTFPDMYHWHDRKIYNMKWQYACNHADRIVCISECTKKDVLEFYNVPERKVTVVYQPVNPIYYQPSERIADKPSYMLYVGSINPRKNLLGIINAWEQMPQDVKLPLIVVGCGGSYKRKIQQYLAEKGQERWVEWRELVSNAELKRLYTNAEMLVCPSFYGGGYEPMVEALLCGCPVVTSHANRLPGKGNSYVMQADPNSTDDLCDKMVKLLTDSDLREQTIEQGRAYMMETFAPKTLAQQLMAVYEAVKR
jgi:glycosyltransferase involved in cell wall biosynthesis